MTAEDDRRKALLASLRTAEPVEYSRGEYKLSNGAGHLGRCWATIHYGHMIEAGASMTNGWEVDMTTLLGPDMSDDEVEALASEVMSRGRGEVIARMGEMRDAMIAYLEAEGAEG